MNGAPLVDDAASLLDELSLANRRFGERYPGESPARQPVHVVYGGAQLFHARIAERLGARAIEAIDQYAPDPFTFARALGLEGASELPRKRKSQWQFLERMGEEPEAARALEPSAYHAARVYERMRSKLEREPVEDFRIDFEDGYGVRPDAEEDVEAVRCAEELARGLELGSLPPFVGIRIKPLNEEMKRRAVRTLDLFVGTLLEHTSGKLPSGFVITLPKVPIPEQVGTLARLLERLEARHGLTPGALKIELMIELTQSLFDARGLFQLPLLVQAGEGRVVGAHFGTYDYTASCTITAAHQSMEHPASQIALHLMKIALGGTPTFLSDGATNVLPVPIHRAPEGARLTRKQLKQNARAVHDAWRLAFRQTQNSLLNGFYQGWDLHPAQLPVRYAALYDFFLRGFDAAAARLRNFVEKAAQATLVGDVFDDAATGQGLLNYFLRAQAAGAVSQDELEATGLSLDELRTRSFAKILATRTVRGRTS